MVLLGCVLFFIIRKANKYFNIVFEKYDDLNASVQENVSAIRVVKAYVREEYETNKFANASAKVYNMFVKAESIIACNMPVMMFTVYTCILLISWVGAHMIVSDSLTTGNLMSLLAYCMNILMSLMMLSMVFVMISMSMASGRRIAEVINETATIHNDDDPVMEVKDGSVVFDHVYFKYKENAEGYVLKDINIDIKSGETIGIIGGTGSAKTSLVNLISRLYDVTDGSVRVGGTDVRKYDMEALRNKVAVVLQKNTLFSGTIYENLRWGNKEATDEMCRRACKLACADEFIERMPDGYNTYIEQGGSNVSGGQKQRLCIARALLKEPKILILDDSTSAVDTATDARIRKAFATEIPDTTKIIIAQRISSVEHADRIIVMNEGQINGIGTHEELLEGNDIVAASSKGKMRLTSRIFYSLYNMTSRGGGRIGPETFRIISRRAINRIKSIGQYIPYRKAVYSNCGLNAATMYYESRDEKARITNETVASERTSLALDSFIYFTNVLERVSMVICCAFLVFTVAMGIYLVSDLFNSHKPVEGWLSTMGFLALGFFGVFALLTIILKYLSVLLNLIYKHQRYLVSDIEKIARK